MSRNAGRRPKMSVHIRTAGLLEPCGWNSAASATPSGVLTSTSLSTTASAAAAAPAMVRPAAVAPVVKPRLDKALDGSDASGRVLSPMMKPSR